MYIYRRCRYCQKWERINLNTHKGYLIECCSKICSDNYFKVTGSGFNLSFSHQDIIKINKRESKKPAYELIEIHLRGLT